MRSITHSLSLIQAIENESPSISPLFGALSRTATYKRSSESEKSRGSNKSLSIRGRNSKKASSRGSTVSFATKHRNATDWNERTRNDSSGLCYPLDPPRPAKEGMEWVRFPEGYWAERKIRDHTLVRGKSRPRWLNRSPNRKSTSSAQRIPRIHVKVLSKGEAGDLPWIQIGSINPKAQTKALVEKAMSPAAAVASFVGV